MKLKNIASFIVPLDVLNNLYQPLARYEARLLDLHGDWATLTLPADASVSCLHWGSLVRFTFSDGAYCCEAEGVVVAHSRIAEMENRTGPEFDSDVLSAPDLRPACREITVQLWQCREREERRFGPRRWSRIAVLMRPERETPPDASASPVPLEDGAEACWERGWAIDMSANGMRLRAHVSLPLKQRVALQFALPLGAGSSLHNNYSGSSISNSSASNSAYGSALRAEAPETSLEETRPARRRFLLTGRVLRSERTRTAASHQAMICFEQLTSEEGLALSRFLHSG